MTASLRRVTFTGVDSRTDLGALKAICAEFPRVEFAALWSMSRAGNEPRYPADPVALLSELPQGQRAIHLCGALATDLAEGHVHVSLGPLEKFCRVQVNKTHYSAEQQLAIGHFAKWFQVEAIIQSRLEYIPYVPGVSVLHDASGGRGIAPREWPGYNIAYRPEDVLSYAGGLGPDTIAEQLPRIAAARGDGLFGIDMESGVRTDDWFDLNKCLAVVKEIERWEASNAR